ncbi:MAG TPA: flagellar biosynthesis protein FlhB [Syntrophobacteraceae bacterium]|jgi:flagellar biosynthesis protein FlhB|nr:flagellar biosynthesis protein FlhB [Syntrophobacteraceae bacterium]HBD10439.1 flagellar biosynthesis protein FlhB [Syntrophobacteraceae bacterium]HBZ56108.1 flagellar biosynthesis protein FlhB [Syntrophobacteraceae bacterium]
MAAAGDKSEKPTGKRIRDTRRKGRVAKSRELNVAVTCLGGSYALYFSVKSIYQHMNAIILELWGHGFAAAQDGGLSQTLLMELAQHFFIMIAPVALVIMALALATDIVQIGGFLVAWEGITPKISNISPMRGLKNLFSPRALVELAKSLFKLFIILYIVYLVIRDEQHQFLPLIESPVADSITVLGNLTLKILVRSGLAMLILSVVDYVYQRWQYTRDLMMTKQEVKEEHKQSEGNPQIKARIRSLQRSLARRRMMAKIPKATVVITNPTHYAVAVQYHKHMEAPMVLAKGQNLIAQRIIQLARKHRVPVVSNPPLARALYKQVELEEQIPLALYRAVAKVLAFIYQQREARNRS